MNVWVKKQNKEHLCLKEHLWLLSCWPTVFKEVQGSVDRKIVWKPAVAVSDFGSAQHCLDQVPEHVISHTCFYSLTETLLVFFLFKWKSLQQGFALCPVLSVMDFLEPIVWASLLLQLSACEADIYHHQLIVSDKVLYACWSWRIHLSLAHCKASPELLSAWKLSKHDFLFQEASQNSGWVGSVSGVFNNIFSSLIFHLFNTYAV